VIRSLRERRWHPERRRWTVARGEIDGLCRTTRIYTHVTSRDLVRIRSPLDMLAGPP
jgi:hypothetical protein